MFSSPIWEQFDNNSVSLQERPIDFMFTTNSCDSTSYTSILSEQERAEEEQQNLNGVTEILKFGASLVEGFIALMGQKVTISHLPEMPSFIKGKGSK